MTENTNVVKGYDEPFSIVYHDVWDSEDITPQERYVYLCLLRYANFYDKKCFPSLSTICKKTKYGRSTVVNTIKSLEEKGLVVKKGRVKKDNSQDTNLYIINRIGSSVEYKGSTVENLGSSVEYTGSIEEYTKKKQLNNKQINNILSSNEDITLIVEYLNKKTGMNYKPTNNKTVTLIKARLNEKYTVEDFYKVIDVKTNTWLNNPEFSKYLRPITLFGTKFENYLNESNTYKQKEEGNIAPIDEMLEEEMKMLEQMNKTII